MKNLFLVGILLMAGWSGYAFFSAYLDRVNFQNEVDSLLQTPREMGEKNLPGLIVRKAQERGIAIDPDEVDVRIRSAGASSELSEKFEGKGFQTETRVLDLHFQYSQNVLGMTRTYSFDRERTFTSRVTPRSAVPSDLEDEFR